MGVYVRFYHIRMHSNVRFYHIETCPNVRFYHRVMTDIMVSLRLDHGFRATLMTPSSLLEKSS